MKVDIQYLTYAKLDFELETHFSCSILTTRQRFSFKRDLGLRVGIDLHKLSSVFRSMS